ncbi:MAG: PEP-CTERM sorting domain-containing protein [Rubripirellula sp.]
MRCFLTLMLLLGTAYHTSAQETVGEFTFEFDTPDDFDIFESDDLFVNTSSYFDVLDQGDPGVATSLLMFNNNDSIFFAARDIDANATTPEAQITFDSLNITGLQNIAFAGLFAEDAASDGNSDWDTDDFFRLEYSIDGGAFAPLLSFISTTADGAALFDRFDDGSLDGGSLNPTFTSYTAPISGTGDELLLRATMSLDELEEDIAFDNFVVTAVAVPEPGSLLALTCLTTGAGIVRRRRKTKSARR